jgi:glucose dehydrogenase
MKRAAFVIFVSLTAAGATVLTQTAGGAAGKDWPSPLGDPGATRFSTLTQINTANVKTLTRAWTFHTGSARFAYPP